MSALPEGMSPDEFVTVAMQHELLTSDQAERLSQLVTLRGQSPGALALEAGMLDAVEVDIVETLHKRRDAIPGYEILSVLGRGGMGVVFRARQIALQRDVAIKTLLLSQLAHRDALPRFEREARSIGQLQHPNIVSAYDYGQRSGRLFLAMELVSGIDLGHTIERHGRFAEHIAWQIARQIASGLAYALKQGIIHRDIKPANVLVVNDSADAARAGGAPLVKISDFGLTYLAEDDALQTRLTQAGRVVGTPNFMAPEQFDGVMASSSTDIYALGCTVFNMLTGCAPYSELNVTQIISRKATEEMPDVRTLVPEISPASAKLLSHMLAADSACRIGEYPELLVRIDKLLLGQTSDAAIDAARPAETVGIKTAARPVARQEVNHVSWLLTTIGVLLLVLGASAYFGWQRFSTPRAPTMIAGQWTQALFRGESVWGWLPIGNPVYGPAKDADKGDVLALRGAIGRSFKLPAKIHNYRIALGVCLGKAEGVELQFAPCGNAPLGDCLALCIEGDRVFLARRTEARLSILRELPAGQAKVVRDTEQASTYHTLRVERHGDVWWAFFDGQIVGHAPANAAKERTECRLVVEAARDGQALFDDIHIDELVPP